jgi:hypothetical protein
MRPLRQKVFGVRNRALLAGAPTSLAKAERSILPSTQKQLQRINQNWIVGRLDDQPLIRNKISIIFDHSRAEIIVGKEKGAEEMAPYRIDANPSTRQFPALSKITKNRENQSFVFFFDFKIDFLFLTSDYVKFTEISIIFVI